MKRFASILAASLLLCTQLTAQDHGSWKAASTTARGITGDVTIASEKLLINFSVFTIADIRPLTQDENTAIFDTEAGAQGTGTLYRLNIPAKRTFLHRNALCGAEDTEWMATFATGKALQLAFFSGAKPPVFTQDAISNSTALCGTFSYTR